MRISLSISIILLWAVISSLSAQVKNEDYEILARAAILKYTIDLNYPSTHAMDPVFLASAIQKVEDIAKNNSYSYDVKVIDSILSFQIISIIDKSSFQLHGLHETVFAINISDSLERYLEVNRENLLQFINERIYTNIKGNERFTLIEFYNRMFAHLNSGFLKVEFYDKSNEKDFQALDKLYRFQDIVTKEKIGKRGYFEHLYKKSHNILPKDNFDPVDFYRIIYTFECNKFKVEQELLLRTKI